MRTALLGGCAGLILLFSAQAYAVAATSPSVLGLDMADPKCTIPAVQRDEERDQSSSIVRGLDHQLAIMASFDRLMKSRTWKRNVSMGEQMTPAEANEFGNLQEQTKIGLLSMMLESKRGRDLQVLGRMADMAKSMQGDFQLPDDPKSEEFSLVGLILAGREKFQVPDSDEVNLIERQGTCTLQNAFIAESKRTLYSIDQIPGVHRVTGEVTALGEKYGDPIDRAKLDENEKLSFDQNAVVMRAVTSRQTYYKDLLFLARLEGVSKLQRDTRRRSQYEAPGDADHINVVWNAWVKEGKITADQDNLSRIVNFINDKFPTDMMKQMPK